MDEEQMFELRVKLAAQKLAAQKLAAHQERKELARRARLAMEKQAAKNARQDRKILFAYFAGCLALLLILLVMGLIYF